MGILLIVIGLVIMTVLAVKGIPIFELHPKSWTVSQAAKPACILY